MARVVGALHTSHAAWVNTPPDQWDSVRANRRHRPDVPGESDSEKMAKHERMQQGKRFLKDKLVEFNPDVILVFGDDQSEMYDFDNLPALSIFTGAEYSGRRTSETPNPGNRPGGGSTRNLPDVPNHQGLAKALLLGLLESGFDPAYSTSVPEGRAMAHAVMNPLRFWEHYTTPTVPLLINAYYTPQVRAKRCYEVGREVRRIIDSYPEDLRVVVIGSGGLWHTPNQQEAYLDEEFDKKGLEFLRAGEILKWAEFFDAYEVPVGDLSQDYVEGKGKSGLPTLGGPQGGTRETCNWIGAAAVLDGLPSVILDYVPVYASPLGVAFAYTESP